VRPVERSSAGSGRVLPGIAAVVFLFAACATERAFVWVGDVPATPGQAEEVIQARDTINVTVRDQPAMSSGDVVVHDDGAYLQPLLGNIQAAGKTVTQLRTELQAAMKSMIVNPVVTVSLVKVGPIRVKVVGEVKTPGAYELSRDRGVAAALAAAGWVTDFAARDRVFVVRARESGPRIRFRLAELTTPEPRSAQFQLRDEDVVIVE